MSREREREALVAALRRQGVVRSEGVERALLAVPRHAFVPMGGGPVAYTDAPVAIASGQTISAPHMVAMMAEALDLRPGHRVLEVGAGSGYAAAVLSHLVAPDGRVTAVECIPGLARQAALTLRGLDLPTRVDVELGDGAAGWPAAAPFDRVSVAAAAPAVPPPLLSQLAPGGVIVIPLGSLELQQLTRVSVDPEGRVVHAPLGSCCFVPLVGAYGFSGV